MDTMHPSASAFLITELVRLVLLSIRGVPFNASGVFFFRHPEAFPVPASSWWYPACHFILTTLPFTYD